MIQTDLKIKPSTQVNGLNVVYDFISAEEELLLVRDIENELGEPMNLRRGGRSIIKRWGSEKPYNNFVSPNATPDFLLGLAQKLVDEKYLDELPNSISINCYMSGDYIAPHIDSKDSGEKISVLSLLSAADMVLDRGNEKMEVPLPARTLVQMSGEIRWKYRHSILPVTSTRYSVVFRKSNS